MTDSNGSNITFLIAFTGAATFFLTLLISAITGTWKLSGLRTEMAVNLSGQIGNSRSMFEDAIDKLRSEVGEGLAAVRTKVTEVELWGRDNYIRRESFYKMMEHMTETVRLHAEKADGNMQRIEEKITAIQVSIAALGQQQLPHRG